MTHTSQFDPDHDLGERGYYEDLLGKGRGDPDMRWIGIDKPVVHHDFSMAARDSMFDDSDNMPNDPLEADLEDIHQTESLF